MTLSPEVLAIAEAQAASDRDALARLVRSGVAKKVEPGAEYSWGQVAFIADIERRAGRQVRLVHSGINLAIRPKRKKGKR